ncbi:hypothetical protein BH18GEM1_BH18GEM1_06820 [soil metagenome]
MAGLLRNLAEQTLPPWEVVVVDGALDEDRETEQVVREAIDSLLCHCIYLRQTGGTAVQRNAGIERATGDFIAFVDDDIRLEADFFQVMVDAFAKDVTHRVGGIVGYRSNQWFPADRSPRWKWYRRLRLLTTYEPGRYDFITGYPINANMQPPFSGIRSVDFMTTSCAVWRREVMEEGLRFDPFFRDYGVLEDAHFSLRAGREWELWQCGDARCVHLEASGGRVDRRSIGYKCVVNYHYVFKDIAGPLSWKSEARFWRYQAFELLRLAVSSVTRRRMGDLSEVRGRLDGVLSFIQQELRAGR